MKQSTRLEVMAVRAETKNHVGLLVEVTAPTLSTTQIKRRAQAVIFVVDRSGSMGGGRLDLVKNTIGELIGRLPKDDYVSIVSFDSKIEIHQPMTPVSGLNLPALRRNLDTLSPRGGTNIELGFSAGLDEAKKLPTGVEATLILLSDGQANEGIRSVEELGRLAASATEHYVKTSTLGIGLEYNEQILAQMASTGQGNHFAAVELADAVAGLQDEIDGLLLRAIEQISCRISLDVSGAKVVALGYVRNEIRSAHSLTVQLGDLASGETRGYAFMLELPVLAAGSTINVKTSVRSRRIDSGEALEDVNTVAIAVQESKGFVTPQIDEDVAAEVMTYRLAEIKQRAIDAARTGDLVLAKLIVDQARGDISLMLANSKSLSPRVRARIQAEGEELGELLEHNLDSFGKRATESMLRTSRAKSDPRKRDQ